MGIISNPYFKLFRVFDWGGYVLISLFGFVVAKGFLFPLEEIVIFWGIVLSFLAFGFSINDCFDVKEDIYDKSKENPLISHKADFKKTLLLSFSAAVLGLILSALLGVKIFLFCLAGLIVGFFYSAPPVRFKTRPFLDLLSHGFFAGAFLFLLPVLISGIEITRIYWVIAFYVFYLSVTLELRNHVEDYASDKAGGVNTSVVFLGHELSKKILDFMTAFYPLILFPVFLPAPYRILGSFFISSIVFLSVFLFGKTMEVVKNYKVSDIYAIVCFSLLALYVLL